MPQKVVDHPRRRRLPAAALLARVSDLAAQWLAPRVERLLVALDDDLFLRAEAAHTDAGQQQYFDAMRLLRFERDALARRFLEGLDAPVAPGDAPGGDDFTSRVGALTLLDDEILEQRLAVTTMSRAVERELDLPLTLLGERVRALLDERRAEDPVGAASAPEPAWAPHRVADAWARALAPLGLASEVRLVLFKHFEHEVLRPIGALCEQQNTLLADAGVLPDLSPADALHTRRSRRPSPPEPAAAEQATVETPPTPGPGGAADEAPASGPGPGGARGATRRLLDGLPGLGSLRRYSAAGAGGRSSAPPLAGAPLLAGADAAQRDWYARAAHRSLDELPERCDLALAVLRHGAGEDARLATRDEDLINLLQTLFDALLADPNLSVPLRALIARIQFPVLRVALAEPAFLVERAHPARRFLDVVTRVGIGWVRADERAQDRLYAALEHAVDGIAATAAPDGTLFGRLEREIAEALDAEADAVRRASERIVAQERARIAAERTRRLVERLVAHRLASVPEPTVARFLGTEWQQVMLRVHQQDGPNSDTWRAAFTVLRRLSGGNGPDGPALHRALSDGLERLGRSRPVAERDAAAVLEAWASAGPEWTPTLESEPPRLDAAPPRTEAPEVEQLPDRRAIARANALECGDWVEIDHRSGRRVRCRLASVTDAPERCIFVNRRGVRIDTLSRLELAAGFEAGRVRALRSEALFDAALEEVITHLRSGAA